MQNYVFDIVKMKTRIMKSNQYHATGWMCYFILCARCSSYSQQNVLFHLTGKALLNISQTLLNAMLFFSVGMGLVRQGIKKGRNKPVLGD